MVFGACIWLLLFNEKKTRAFMYVSLSGTMSVAALVLVSMYMQACIYMYKYGYRHTHSICMYTLCRYFSACSFITDIHTQI